MTVSKFGNIAKVGLNEAFREISHSELTLDQAIAVYGCMIQLPYIEDSEVILLANTIETAAGFGTEGKREFTSDTINKLRLVVNDLKKVCLLHKDLGSPKPHTKK